MSTGNVFESIDSAAKPKIKQLVMSSGDKCYYPSGIFSGVSFFYVYIVLVVLGKSGLIIISKELNVV